MEIPNSVKYIGEMALNVDNIEEDREIKIEWI